jgi:mannan endo-1,6-alpha-mannosidase
MQFFWLRAAVVLAAFLPLSFSIQFNPDDEGSIKDACSTYAKGLMSYYKNGAPNTASEKIGTFPSPDYYWWEAGAIWGGVIEYSTLIGDAAYDDTVVQALVANSGPNKDIILPWMKSQEGNDDQAFWALAFMSALEYKFKDPKKSDPQYFEVVTRAFDNIASRWNTESCGGGLKWQIYPENDYGYFYRNAVSSGTLFALASRLARYTGDKKYADWADKIWDWTEKVGFVTSQYEVFDGADERKNCTEINKVQWSYNLALYLHGAAGMYDVTKGADVWQKRTSGFLDHASIFFKDDVMFESACETINKCNNDMKTFKAYLSRWMAKTALLAPFTKDKIEKYLRTSAIAAAKTCSGGDDGSACGMRWYTGSFDGEAGLGQQLTALEVTQSLLWLKKGPLPAVAGAPSEPQEPSSSPSPSSDPTPSSTPEPSPEVAPSAPASPDSSPDHRKISGDSPEPSSPVASPSSVAGDTVPASSTPVSAITSTTPIAVPDTNSTGALPTASGPSSGYSTGTSKTCDCESSTITTTVWPSSPSAAFPTSSNATGIFTPTPSRSAPEQVSTNVAVNVKMVMKSSLLGAVVVAVLGGM